MNCTIQTLTKLLPVLTLLFSICACTPEKEKEAKTTHQTKERIETPEIIEVDPHYTRISKLIAGMDTTLSYDHPEWSVDSIRMFADNVNHKYNKMKETRLDKISKWNTRNCDRVNVPDTSFCFYPFSGGDFIHAAWLFPNASEYLLVAREAVGSVPDLLTFEDSEVLNYLDNVDEVLRDIYRRSYFITMNMISDIHKKEYVNGMFPIILWAAARSHHEIINVSYFNVDASGNADIITEAPDKPDGVTIKVKHVPSGKIKAITYLSADISNKGFEKHPEIKTFLENKVPGECNTFVKSASYLMHYGTFDEIRDLVLNKSNVLVQDDTGIPFKSFDQDIWNIELYGEYEKPVKDFSENLYQKDLDSAYTDDEFYKGSLDFSLGYHWGSKNQNEMFIYKMNEED